MVLVVTLLAGITACSGDGRPSADEWQPQWDAVLDAMPTQDELGDPPDPELCEQTLGMLRQETPALQPTPDMAIDDVVRQWAHIAEAIVFECPPQSHALPDLDHAYAELALLEAEVDAALATGTQGS